jgi:outer membrane protein OmpA-like peptidoglycan-associated protein
MAASFTDLMTSLMVIFVLLFVAYVSNASAKGKTVQDDLLAQLRKQLNAIGLSPDAVRRDERDRNAIVIVMPDSLLFDRGKKVVREGGQRSLQGLMPLLSDVLCGPSMRPNIQTVVVEGHTDTTWAAAALANVGPERGRDFNLELSQGRSMEVVKTSLAALGKSEQRACFRGLLSASGRGQEEPLQGISGDDPRQRRVVFKIRVATDVTQQVSEDMTGGGRKVETAR